MEEAKKQAPQAPLLEDPLARGHLAPPLPSIGPPEPKGEVVGYEIPPTASQNPSAFYGSALPPMKLPSLRQSEGGNPKG